MEIEIDQLHIQKRHPTRPKDEVIFKLCTSYWPRAFRSRICTLAEHNRVRSEFRHPEAGVRHYRPKLIGSAGGNERSYILIAASSRARLYLRGRLCMVHRKAWDCQEDSTSSRGALSEAAWVVERVLCKTGTAALIEWVASCSSSFTCCRSAPRLHSDTQIQPWSLTLCAICRGRLRACPRNILQHLSAQLPRQRTALGVMIA